MNVINLTCYFKLKLFLDGSIKRLKGQFCESGDQKLEGIGSFIIYAPIFHLTIVSLLLIMEFLLELKSNHGDITYFFLHAYLKEDDNICQDEGEFYKKVNIPKLNKNIFGLHQSQQYFRIFPVKKMK